MSRTAPLLGLATLALLAGCSEPGGAPASKAGPAPVVKTAAKAPPADADTSIKRINGAAFSPPVEAQAPPAGQASEPSATAPDPMLVKAQVLLARAGFSPGEIDTTSRATATSRRTSGTG